MNDLKFDDVYYIKKGEYYEDCRYIPRLCVESNYIRGGGDLLRGISLIDGSLGDCSPYHCVIVKLSLDEALMLRENYRGAKSDSHTTQLG